MTFETLKRSHLKRNILIAVGVVLILSAVILTFTRAKYRTTQSMPLLQGTINFSPSDFNMVAMYLNQDGALPAGQTDIVPKFGYTLNEEQSTCESPDGVEDNVGINYVDSSLTFSNVIKKGTKCTAYFDLIPDSENPTINSINSSADDTSITVTVDASDNIGVYYYYFKIDDREEIRLEQNTYTFENLKKGDVHLISVRVEDAAGNEASTSKEVTVGLYGGDYILASVNPPTGQTTDWTNNGTGTTYYYTGNPNNWVQFGGFWWRIIRINGDGTIRMIYQGTSANTTGTGTQIGTSGFSIATSDNDNAYVGFKYTIGQIQGTSTNSVILNALNTWYQNNLAGQVDKLDVNAGLCGDRTISSGSGIGGAVTYYTAYGRLPNYPTLQCDIQDIYTTSNSSTGNKSLQYPIGLITADEYASAGVSNSYLNVNIGYWTMTPAYFGKGTLVANSSFGYEVTSNGGLGRDYTHRTYGIRPVINLRSDVQLTGSGTTTDPFVIVS